METCKTCKFFAEHYYECRRHAPVVVQLGTLHETKFPTTFSDFWCGDWELSVKEKMSLDAKTKSDSPQS